MTMRPFLRLKTWKDSKRVQPRSIGWCSSSRVTRCCVRNLWTDLCLHKKTRVLLHLNMSLKIYEPCDSDAHPPTLHQCHQHQHPPSSSQPCIGWWAAVSTHRTYADGGLSYPSPTPNKSGRMVLRLLYQFTLLLLSTTCCHRHHFLLFSVILQVVAHLPHGN